MINLRYSLLVVTDRLRSCLVRRKLGFDVTQLIKAEEKSPLQESIEPLAEDIYLPGVYHRFWTESNKHIFKNVMNPYIIFFLEMTFNQF